MGRLSEKSMSLHLCCNLAFRSHDENESLGRNAKIIKIPLPLIMAVI